MAQSPNLYADPTSIKVTTMAGRNLLSAEGNAPTLGVWAECTDCQNITLDDVLPDGVDGTAYVSTDITVTLGTSPIAIAVTSGSLPAGLSLVDNGDDTATLSGTPTTSETAAFTVTATDANGCTGSRAYSIDIVLKACLVSVVLSDLLEPQHVYVTVSGVSACPGETFTANDIEFKCTQYDDASYRFVDGTHNILAGFGVVDGNISLNIHAEDQVNSTKANATDLDVGTVNGASFDITLDNDITCADSEKTVGGTLRVRGGCAPS